jgi:acetyltransferase-like isoleucine patch superfamily enzyme
MLESGPNPSWRKLLTWALHLPARYLPGAGLRAQMHRWRGVHIGEDVFIGEDVYIENNYPHCVWIGDRAQIGIRTIIMAHLRGPGRVNIEKDAYIGPCCVIAAAHGRTVTIGEGAVVGALSVITADVPPRAFVRPPPAEPVAQVRQPLATAASYKDFMRGLAPLKPKDRNVQSDASAKAPLPPR